MCGERGRATLRQIGTRVQYLPLPGNMVGFVAKMQRSDEMVIVNVLHVEA